MKILAKFTADMNRLQMVIWRPIEGSLWNHMGPEIVQV